MQQKFISGDRVMVPGVVKNDQSKEDSVYISVGYHAVFFHPDEVKLVNPFFAVGDVAWLPTGISGEDLEKVTVLSVHGDMVWIRDENGNFSTVKAINLTRKLKVIEDDSDADNRHSIPSAPEA